MAKALKLIGVKALYVKKQGWTDPKTGTMHPFADLIDVNDVKYNLATWKVTGQLPKAGENWFVSFKEEPWSKGDKSGVNRTITEIAKAITDNEPVQAQTHVKTPNLAIPSGLEGEVKALRAELSKVVEFLKENGYTG